MREDQKGILELEQTHRAMVEQSLKSSRDLSTFEHYIFNQLQADCEDQIEKLKQEQLPLYKQQSKPSLRTDDSLLMDMSHHHNGA